MLKDGSTVYVSISICSIDCVLRGGPTVTQDLGTGRTKHNLPGGAEKGAVKGTPGNKSLVTDSLVSN